MKQRSLVFLTTGLIYLGLGLGFLGRFVWLSELVPILNRDEAALAYNAYLLKNAGVDEWGRAWPLALESFGDWKLLGYPALLVGLFNFLPTADWVVRLPSALAGVGIVILSFFFAKFVFKFGRFYALLFTFLVASAPFALFYSRFAYEANVALFYFLLALFLLWLKVKKLSLRYLLDALATGLLLLASFTYNTPFLLTPFLWLFLLLARDLKQVKTWLVGLSFLVGGWLLALYKLWPVLMGKNDITIFTDPAIFFQFVQFRLSLGSSFLTKLVANRYVYDLYLILKHFFASFLPDFLVFSPHHPWHAVPGTGQLYLSVWFLGLVGLLVLIYKLFRLGSYQGKLALKVKRWLINYLVKVAPTSLLLIYLLVISLAPAVVTTDAPHATRSLLFLWLFLVFAVYGAQAILERLRKDWLLWGQLGLVVILLFEFFNYLPKLFVNYHKDQVRLYQSTGFQEGLNQLEAKYKDQAIAVVDPGGYQYILLAWYLKLPPEVFLNQNKRQLPNNIGLRYGEQVKNYHFIVDPKDRSDDEKVLFYWDEGENKWQIRGY